MLKRNEFVDTYQPIEAASGMYEMTLSEVHELVAMDSRLTDSHVWTIEFDDDNGSAELVNHFSGYGNDSDPGFIVTEIMPDEGHIRAAWHMPENILIPLDQERRFILSGESQVVQIDLSEDEDLSYALQILADDDLIHIDIIEDGETIAGIELDKKEAEAANEDLMMKAFEAGLSSIKLSVHESVEDESLCDQIAYRLNRGSLDPSEPDHIILHAYGQEISLHFRDRDVLVNGAKLTPTAKTGFTL